mgnify:CR=1 FL=1
MKNKSIFLIPLAVIAVIIYGAAYSVDETEQVVVTRFDKIQRTVTNPGLHFKLPVIEKAAGAP